VVAYHFVVKVRRLPLNRNAVYIVWHVGAYER